MMLLLASLLAFQDTAKLDQLVSGLRSDRVEERDRATRDLQKLGSKALPVLESLISDADLEVAWRARTLIVPWSGPLAQVLFLRFEERVLQARSVKIRFRCVDPNEAASLMAGELWIKEGNKVRGWFQGPLGKKSTFARLQCDGKRVRVERGAPITVNWTNVGPPFEREAPAGLSDDLLKSFLRVGMLSAISAQANRLIAGGKGDLASGLRIRSERLQFRGNGSNVLKFVVPIGGDVLEQELSLQAQRGGLSDRRILRGDLVIAKEVYEEFDLDRDIPDDTFMLPEK